MSADGRRNRFALAAGLLLAIGIAAANGCRSGRLPEPLVGPLPLSTPQLLSGQQVFMQHCYQCHPGGSAGLGPGLNDKPLPAALIRTQVRAGMGAMPAFDEHHINDKQLDALAAYVVALRKHGR